MNRDFLDQVQTANVDIPNGFFCEYCKRILLNPFQSKCGHRFCEECRGRIEGGASSCPKCHKEVSDFHYDYAVEREINDLVIKCPLEECLMKNATGKVCEHFSNCSKHSCNSQISNDSDYTLENEDFEQISSLEGDINEEIQKMKRSIEILTNKSDHVQNLSTRFESLRSKIEFTATRNEKNMKDFIIGAEENYRKIESLVNQTKCRRKSSVIENNNSDLEEEITALKEKYSTIEDFVNSQNVYNSNIKQSLGQLYSKIKILEDEKKLNFNQFYEEVEYLANEFSIIKTANEKKVVKFYNKIDRHSDKLLKVGIKLPDLYQEIKKLKKKVSAAKKKKDEENEPDLNDLEKEVSALGIEVASLKETVNHLTNHYPSSVFVSVFFQEKIGMNMSLREIEIFIEQFESSLDSMRGKMSFGTGSNRNSLMNSKRILRRRSAFNISDRKKKASSKNIDEV